MTINTETIFVRFVDGVDVSIPIPARAIGDATFQLLPDRQFDYDDDTVLFEFGEGDIVRAKRQKWSDGIEGSLAFELVSDGNTRNVEKRMLFQILENHPPEQLLTRFGLDRLRTMFEQLNRNESPFDGIQIKHSTTAQMTSSATQASAAPDAAWSRSTVSGAGETSPVGRRIKRKWHE